MADLSQRLKQAEEEFDRLNIEKDRLTNTLKQIEVRQYQLQGEHKVLKSLIGDAQKDKPEPKASDAPKQDEANKESPQNG